MLAEDDVAGLLATQAVTVLGHILVHIFVTDCSLLIGDALPVKCLVKTEVDMMVVTTVLFRSVPVSFMYLPQMRDQVSVYHAAVLIYRDAAVCVAAVVSKSLRHSQSLSHSPGYMDVGGAAVGVDVQTVRMVVDDMGLCAQSVKYVLAIAEALPLAQSSATFCPLEGTGWQWRSGNR